MGGERHQASQPRAFFAAVWVVAMSTMEALCRVGTPQGSSSTFSSPGVFRLLSALFRGILPKGVKCLVE